jgi:hypothetical protein
VARKRKVVYPPPKTSTVRPAPGAIDPRNPPGRSVSINLAAAAGQPQVAVGVRVRITTGLYAGEIARVEAVGGGVIPSALVRTEAGRTRRARTIDLEIVRPGTEASLAANPGPSPVENA